MFDLSHSMIGNIVQILLVTGISLFYIRSVLKKDCGKVYVLAYGLRMALLLFSVYGGKLGKLPFDGADTEYFYDGVRLGKNHEDYLKDVLVTLSYFISFVLGDSRLLYQYLMTMISMLGMHLTDKSMLKLNIAGDIRYKCLLLFAFFPSFAMFNIMYTREPIVMTCIIGSFYLFLRYLQETDIKKSILFLGGTFIVAIIACPLHAAPVAVLVGYIIAILFYDNKSDKFKITKRSFLIGVPFAVCFAVLYLLFPQLFIKVSHIWDVKSIARRFMFDSNLAAGSSYAQYVGDSDTWGRFILFTPARMFYAMFAPLPWEWRGLADIATFFGNSIFYLIVSAVALINVFRKKYWSNFNRWFVFTLLIVAATVGWGCIAFGTAIRHRDKFFPLFVVLMALEIRGRNVRDCDLAVDRKVRDE